MANFSLKFKIINIYTSEDPMLSSIFANLWYFDYISGTARHQQFYIECIIFHMRKELDKIPIKRGY